jgi:hypothetical protein
LYTTSKRAAFAGKSTAVMSETWVYSAAVWYLRKVKTGTTPAGGMQMVSSSFQTENLGG